MALSEQIPAPAPLAAGEGKALLGISLVILAVFFFACLELSAKLASAYMPPVQAVWARYMVHLLIMVIFLGPTLGRKLFRTQRLRLQVTRSVLLALTTMCQFTGLKYLQMAELTVINFAAPFMVAALAGVMLGERPGLHRWGAIIVGFLGVLVVIRPGIVDIHWAYFVVLAGTVGIALYLLTTRMVSRVDGAITSLFFTALIGAIVLSMALPFVWQTPSEPEGWLLMLAVGVFGAVGHFIFILGTKYAQGSLLAPFMYVQIVWSVLFGFIVFGDLPDIYTWTGAAVVIASGIYLAWREYLAVRRRRAAARTG